MKIYSVKDTESNTFLKPFTFPTDRDAIEGFKYACNEKETSYYKHPKDYTLVSIASFDERTGVLTIPTSQINIARALDMKIKDEQ